jgi:glycosyltransferase involved in cell wall biosynthesis
MKDRVLAVSADPQGMIGGGVAVGNRLISDLSAESMHLTPGRGEGRLRPLGWSLLGRTAWGYYLPLSPNGRKQAHEFLTRFRPTAVLANGFGHPVVDQVAAAAIDRGVHTVIVVHGLPNLNDKPYPLRALAEAYLRHQTTLLAAASAVACPSDFVAQQLRSLYSGSVEAIPWGVDSAQSDERAPTESGPSPRLIAVARIVPLKRLEVLIRSLSLIRRQWPDVRLDVVGPTVSRRYLKFLLTTARDLDLGEAVSIKGPLSASAYRSALYAADLYVSASRQESFGLANVEACAAGLPFVATDVGIVRRLVEGGSGRLVPVDVEPEGFAVAVAGILADYRRIAQDATRAAPRVRAAFDWSRCVSRYARLLSPLYVP